MAARAARAISSVAGRCSARSSRRSAARKIDVSAAHEQRAGPRPAESRRAPRRRRRGSCPTSRRRRARGAPATSRGYLSAATERAGDAARERELCDSGLDPRRECAALRRGQAARRRAARPSADCAARRRRGTRSAGAAPSPSPSARRSRSRRPAPRARPLRHLRREARQVRVERRERALVLTTDDVAVAVLLSGERHLAIRRWRAPACRSAPHNRRPVRAPRLQDRVEACIGEARRDARELHRRAQERAAAAARRPRRSSSRCRRSSRKRNARNALPRFSNSAATMRPAPSGSPSTVAHLVDDGEAIAALQVLDRSRCRRRTRRPAAASRHRAGRLRRRRRTATSGSRRSPCFQRTSTGAGADVAVERSPFAGDREQIASRR